MDTSSAQNKPFTTTTLNTQFARAVASPEAAHVLAGCDIALLQEVIDIDHRTLQINLGTAGLTLAAQNQDAGLAIALSERFSLNCQEYFVLQSKSRMAEATKCIGLDKRFRERGMLLANVLDNQTGKNLTVATAHPVVAARPLARAKQVSIITDTMLRHYATGPFILGADMNHYPTANKVDKQMAQKGRLKTVSNNDPTCYLQDTRHGWLGHLGFIDARLDTLLFRSLGEVSSKTIDAESDHKGIQATFTFLAK